MIVVTGGAGFIGSHIVDVLVHRGEDVRVLDDLSSGYPEFVDPAAELVVGDVADEALVARTLRGAEVVFHEAAHRAVQRSVEHPLATDLANTHGTLTILKAAVDAGVRRVVSASSSSVYGGADRLPTPEDEPLVPRSPYAVSKLAGEHYCRVFAELYGLETISLRYFNVYGPRQRPDSAYAAVIPLFIEAFEQGTRPTIFGDGEQSRDFTYIDDVVAANLAAAAAPAAAAAGHAYNVAGGGGHSLLELIAVLERIFHRHLEPIHADPRPGDVRTTLADISAARQNLGHVPTIPFDEGIRRTVAWFSGRARAA